MATYKIIGFDKTNGSITVSFDENMAPLNVDVPLNDQGAYITGTELDTYIQGFIPTWHLDRISKIAAGVSNESAIEALVEAVPSVEIPLEGTEASVIADGNIAMWQQLETEKQIAKALVKFGVLAEDPTIIQTSTL
jgi:hypothetical protein